MRHRLALVLIVLGFGGAVALQGASAVLAAGPHASLVEIDGAIKPVTARFLARAIDKAVDDRSRLLIVILDTPGGAFNSTRKMVESMLVSTIPIVVYVSPQGAQAASAGAFITAAAHVAAMAPVSNIGAALPPNNTTVDLPLGDSGDLPETWGLNKVDASALLRSIAERRGRNVEALEATVLNASAYSASEALDNGIIDLIAENLDDLMAQLHGRTVQLEEGYVNLETEGLEVVRIEETLLEGALRILSNPTVIYLLLILGGIGVFLEFILGAGLILPGITGLAFLVLAFVGMAQMPVNWAGFALIVVAMVLFYVEIAVVPGKTVFGVTGVISLVAGGFLLFGDFTLPGFEPPPIETPSFRVNPWIIVGVAASVFAFFAFFVRSFLAARRAGTTTPTTVVSLVGQSGVATTDIAPTGEVHVADEYWTAVSDTGEAISEGERVTVLGIEGLTLKVSKPAVSDSLEESSIPGEDRV